MSTTIQQFNELLSQVTTFVSPATSIKVVDASSASDAVETGKKLKEFQKKIDAKRKELTAPLLDRQREINEYAKTIAAPLEKAEKHLKSEIARYEDEQEKIRAAELRRLEEEREAERRRIEVETKAHQAEEAPEAAAGIAVVKKLELQAVDREIRREERAVEATATKGISRPWTSEVVDEALVPREYLMVDVRKINAAVRAGVREITGVRIYQATRVAFGKTTAVTSAALAQDYFGGNDE